MSALLSSSAPDCDLTIIVHVNEWSMPIRVGAGLQSFAWLANLASHHFSHHFHHTRQASACASALCLHTAVNIVDSDDNAYLPSQLLYQHVLHNQHLFLTLSPPSPSFPPPLYHLLSTCPPHQYRPVVLHFDMNRIPTFKLSSSRETDPPYVTSNYHSSFRSSAPMRMHKGGHYRLRLSLPIGSRLFFLFVVKGEATLSDDYETVMDQYGNRLHYLEVKGAVPRYEELKAGGQDLRVFPLPPALTEPAMDVRRPNGEKRPFVDRMAGRCFEPTLLVTEEEEDDERRVFPVQLTGHFLPSSAALLASLSALPTSSAQYNKSDTANTNPSSTAPTSSSSPPLPISQTPLQLRLLDTEWELMRVSDVVDTGEKAALMREALTRHHLMLRAVMASYVSLMPPWTEGLTRLEWLAFCRVCRVQDKRCTVQRLNRIFTLAVRERSPNLSLSLVPSPSSSSSSSSFSSGFSGETSLFSPSSVLLPSSFLSALIRLAALKFKQLAPSSPHTAFESLLSRHVLPFSSLYHLPSSHLRGDLHRSQMGSLSSQSTQEREREKERAKEKLLHAAILDEAVMQELMRREEELFQLWADMQAVKGDKGPTVDASLSLHPLWSQTVGVEAMLRVLAGRRWWDAEDADLLMDCWIDESMDEKQSEKEKEIEREKAAEREKEAGGGGGGGGTGGASAVGGLREERASSSYAMCYAEWMLWMVKLSDRWHLRREKKAQRERDAQKAAARPDLATSRPGPRGDREEGGAVKEESKDQFSVEDDERRREDEDAIVKLRQREMADDVLHHRQLLRHVSAFMRLLFPSSVERERLKAQEERERAEAIAKEVALRAEREKAEKAERAANAKKKEAEGKEAKGGDGKSPAAAKKK